MKKYGKVVVECEHNHHNWAVQVFILSISLSLAFGFLSQTLLSSLGAIFATIGIAVFIFLSVVFDMLGIAAASADEQQFLKWKQEGVKGAQVGVRLVKNCEKVCSFCADVVGDICSTLCGAGGACIVIAITKSVSSPALIMLISVSVSALIAGLTIFFKALMKQRALKNSNNIILKLGLILEKTIFRQKNKENSEK